VYFFYFLKFSELGEACILRSFIRGNVGFKVEEASAEADDDREVEACVDLT
jgi:hypothetical protein